MKDRIRDYFKGAGIEYYSVLDYAHCRQINGDIMERESFTPRSVIVFLVPYYAGETVNLSRYSASLDYHLILRSITDGLSEILRTVRPDAHMKGYGDHSPIDERHAALISGLGILGDSGLLINETYGSYIFIGDLVTDIPAEELSCAAPAPIQYCEHCGICRAACPTGILRGEGEDCLSAITQRKGELTEAEVSLMRKLNTVWGCDECQCHCPHNISPVLTPVEFFYQDRIPYLALDILGAMDKATFQKRAFAWRGRRVVERNLKALGYD